MRGLFSLLAIAFVFHSTGRAEVPQQINIQNVQAAGPGCPGGSYAANISPDGQDFSVLFDQYVAAADMTHPLTRLLCELRINFKVPAGWTFAIVSADYRGFAYAEEGTVVSHQALYSFDGSELVDRRHGFEQRGKHFFKPQQFRGPYNDNYLIHQDLDPRMAPWAPCNSAEAQTLLITTFLTAKNLRPSSQLQAQITLDSVDGSVQSQRYKFAWKRCTPPRPGNGKGPGHPPGREHNNGRGRH